jgi:hypothetical protein
MHRDVNVQIRTFTTRNSNFGTIYNWICTYRHTYVYLQGCVGCQQYPAISAANSILWCHTWSDVFWPCGPTRIPLFCTIDECASAKRCMSWCECTCACPCVKEKRGHHKCMYLCIVRMYICIYTLAQAPTMYACMCVCFVCADVQAYIHMLWWVRGERVSACVCMYACMYVNAHLLLEYLYSNV